MGKKIIIPTALFILVLAFASFALSQGNHLSKVPANQQLETSVNQLSESSIILFYGDGCSHCALVSRYIKDNNVQDRISFVQKEISHNKNNYRELMEKARICDPLASSVGIPFLWDGEKCVIGDTSIINFFKQKINGK